MILPTVAIVTILFAPPPIIGLKNNPLKGSVEALRHQNEVLDFLSVQRVETEKDIENLWLSNKIFRVADADGYFIHKSVKPTNRFLRPEAKKYLACLAEDYYRVFRKKLKVTSLCRTSSFQTHLRKSGVSFADANGGDTQSAHLACTAFDISINGMSQAEINFIVERLVYDRADKKVDAFFEILSHHFHIVAF